MNEHTCARSLTTKLRARGVYVLKLNLNYTAGVPDMWVAGQAGSMWIELKYTPELPKRDSTAVVPNLSALQKQWLCERSRQAVRVCVILFVKAGAVVFDRPDWWTTGMSAGDARSRLISINDLADWICDHLGRKEPENERHHEATCPTDPHPPVEAPEPNRRTHEGAVAAPQGQDGRGEDCWPVLALVREK